MMIAPHQVTLMSRRYHFPKYTNTHTQHNNSFVFVSLCALRLRIFFIRKSFCSRHLLFVCLHFCFPKSYFVSIFFMFLFSRRCVFVLYILLRFRLSLSLSHTLLTRSHIHPYCRRLCAAPYRNKKEI